MGSSIDFSGRKLKEPTVSLKKDVDHTNYGSTQSNLSQKAGKTSLPIEKGNLRGVRSGDSGIGKGLNKGSKRSGGRKYPRAKK